MHPDKPVQVNAQATLVTVKMHVTEAPLGTCDDCGLEGGHIVGCSFLLVLTAKVYPS